ncbi:MAG: zinc ribbon domain-containing protein [Thermodesulfobacteriota bacterium]|nr:zinc ribbon domain-containing protein [Thermodesulfobacteriota bacterium]
MPIYEFQCDACGATSEHLIGPGDGRTVVCNSCGSAKMTRILSAPSHFSMGTGQMPGRTCCGREERCDAPPCSNGGACRRK